MRRPAIRATSAAAPGPGGVRSPSSKRAMSWPSATRRRFTIVRRRGSVRGGGEGAPGGRGYEVGAGDAALPGGVAAPAARLVVADDGDEPDVGAERGEVRGEVAGAAGDGVRVCDGDGRHGGLPCDAGGAAVQVLVEEQVADHGDRQSACSVEHGGQTLCGVLTLRA